MASTIYSVRKMLVYILNESILAYILFSREATLPWKLLHLDAYSKLNIKNVMISLSEKQTSMFMDVGILHSIFVFCFSINSLILRDKLCTIFLLLSASVMFKSTLHPFNDGEQRQEYD